MVIVNQSQPSNWNSKTVLKVIPNNPKKTHRMSSHNQNPDLRYTHFQKPQQNSPTNRKPPPIAQIQHHQKQSGIMSYFSPSSGNTNNNRSTASNPSTTIINQSQQIYFHSSLPPNQFINPTAIPGGSARVQQNHVNSNSSIISNGIRQIPSQKSRPSEKSGIEVHKII